MVLCRICICMVVLGLRLGLLCYEGNVVDDGRNGTL